MIKLDLEKLKPLVKQALEEDIGSGDATTKAIIPESTRVMGKIKAKAKGIVAGLPVAELVFKMADKRIKFVQRKKDGIKVSAGTVIAEVYGPARGILKAERVALNFLQKLSGIATTTSEYVNKVRWHPVKIMDTRKTTPCYRELEKYAVALGGGVSHRMGLYDGIIIKDNHLSITPDIKKVVAEARKKAPPDMQIEVEANSLSRVRQAIEAGANIIMLDNMNIFALRAAVRMIQRHNREVGIRQAYIKTEASGGVTLRNVRRIARTGVDSISIGALTHSPKALDISLEIE